jgi:hypothetical protein
VEEHSTTQGGILLIEICDDRSHVDPVILLECLTPLAVVELDVVNTAQRAATAIRRLLVHAGSDPAQDVRVRSFRWPLLHDSERFADAAGVLPDELTETWIVACAPFRYGTALWLPCGPVDRFASA